MSIKFTKHALQRIKTRNISKDEILEALAKPDKIIKDSIGNSIVHKIKAEYLLPVFYYTKKNSKVVITAYKTSKIDKYL